VLRRRHVLGPDRELRPEHAPHSGGGEARGTGTYS
jgi:hypothetical protein